MKRLAVWLGMSMCILALGTFATAVQEASGTLHQDQTWSGTIRVLGDVYVPPGRTLTILPGTDVRFAPRQDTVAHPKGISNCPAPKAELIVEGTLRAQGTEAQPILFTSASAVPSPGDWGGIVLHGCAAPVTLSHLVIEYADANLTAFNSVCIEHCVIRNAYGGLDDCPSAQHWDVRIGLNLCGEGIVVRDCEIIDNTWGCTINQGSGGPVGIATQILDCTIRNNNVTSRGFDVPNGIHVFQSNAHIAGNTFTENTWGIEIGISNVVIIDNAFISNDFGVVLYSPDGPSTGHIWENSALNNGMDYVRMPPSGPEPLPESWFQDPDAVSAVSPHGDTASTRIVIDGRADDWSDYPTLRVDGQGDSDEGGFDLKSVRAFTNDQYLYLLLDAYGDIGEYVQIDLDIDINGDGDREYMATFRPRTNRRDFGDFTSGQGVWDTMKGGDAAEAVELKMPLTLVGGHESFFLGIRVMNGVCCEEEWYCAEEMSGVSIPHSSELEGALAQRLAAWLTTPFEGPASIPFVIADLAESLEGARGLYLSDDETTAYIVAEFSGMLSRVDIDTASATFGQVTPLASDLYVPTDVAIDESKGLAYVTRERSPTRGRNCLTAITLASGMMRIVTDDLGQLTSVELSSDGRTAYVVSMSAGEIHRVRLATGTATRLARGLVGRQEPFAIAVNRAETLAYVATAPARAGEYPAGDLLRIDLRTGLKSVVAGSAIQGGSGITLTADERLALVTEFGHEGRCSGALSAIVIDPASPNYGRKTILLSGLCGPHSLGLAQNEGLLFFVEVDSGRFSVIRISLDRVL